MQYAVLFLFTLWPADLMYLMCEFRRFLGLHEDVVIPESCSSAFEIICGRMEDRLTYKNDEQVKFT